MPDRVIATFVRVFLCAALFHPLVAQAQEDRLYRVELIVFSQGAGGAAEQWEAMPDLAYPKTSRFLTYPGEYSAAAAGEQPTAALPAAFVALPATQHELNGPATNMQRSGRYRILFHEAWVQPMPSESASVPIVLDRSGDGGKWPALQGSVQLYMANNVYLHTNLWLNTQGEYLHSSWRMPPPPRGPASTQFEERLQTPLESAAFASPEAPQAESASAAAQNPAVAGEMADSAYPFRHAVLLKQTRRVRGGQVNYIDHPMLGVVVKVTAVEQAVPEPATGADAGAGQAPPR